MYIETRFLFLHSSNLSTQPHFYINFRIALTTISNIVSQPDNLRNWYRNCQFFRKIDLLLTFLEKSSVFDQYEILVSTVTAHFCSGIQKGLSFFLHF